MHTLKHRQHPIQLSLFTLLKKRHTLTQENTLSLHSRLKGFDGEREFDSLAKKSISVPSLNLNDLLLTASQSSFQVDFLLILPDTVRLYEVKNYEGSYELDGDLLRTSTGHIIGNPKDQLNKATALFHRYLRGVNRSFKVEAYVVFINEHFTLHNAPKDSPFLMWSELQRHFDALNRSPGVLGKKEHALAQALLRDHQDEATFQRKLPSYTFSELKKGLTCLACDSFELELTERQATCFKCGSKSRLQDLILASIEEFQFLFPKEKLTRNTIHTWCGDKLSKHVIWMVLHTHFKREGVGKGSYYV